MIRILAAAGMLFCRLTTTFLLLISLACLIVQALSFNELGFDALTKVPAPAVVVIIAASTGDGDAPDNSATFFAHMRRRSASPSIREHPALGIMLGLLCRTSTSVQVMLQESQPA